jgi:PII-like signaling protein
VITEVPMRILDGELVLARVFMGESDKWHHQPLYLALVERLRREGFAGATVLRGITGFGARSIVHTTHLLDLSADLPLVVEIVDTDDHVQSKLLPILDEMVKGGLVTLEKARVVRYGETSAPLHPSR